MIDKLIISDIINFVVSQTFETIVDFIMDNIITAFVREWDRTFFFLMKLYMAN